MDIRLLRSRRDERGRPTRAGALVLSLLALAAVAAFAGPASAVPPANTTAPSITGTPAVGQTLTAQNGTWSNSPTAFQYRWRRCDSAGAGCVNIAGATGAQKTYTIAAADAAHTLRVIVTAVNADGARSAVSPQTAAVTAPGAPENTAKPTITGTAQAGETLTATDGTWTGSPTSFTYQWQQCDSDGSNCANIAGGTQQTYAVDGGDVGFRLRVQVTAKNDKGTGTALSAVTAIVDPATPVTNARPTLRIISVRFLGARAYARVRICDDKPSNLGIIETDSRPGFKPQTRRFATLVPPQPCGVYTRNWLPAQRFRHGRYTITLSARDKSAQTSAPARKTFVRR